MKTKIKIESIFGKLLFEFECENNSISNTVEEAIKSCANLSCANLRGADLSDVLINETTSFFTISCPEEGSFIAFKKADSKIVKLLVCEDAKRSSATSLKCRCSKAKVLSIEDLDGTISDLTEVKSNYKSDFIYKIGETVEVTDFDENRFNECSTGIHFFMSREQAKQY